MFVAVLFSRIVNGCITTMTVQILLYLEVSKRSTWAGHYGPYSYFSSCLGCLLVLVFLVYYTYSLYLISTAFFSYTGCLQKHLASRDQNNKPSNHYRTNNAI